MIRPRYILWLLLGWFFAGAVSALGQLPDTVWSRTVGGVGQDEGFSVKQTYDGGYIVAGATTSFGAGGSDGYLVKTDENGFVLWTRSIGLTYNDMFNSIELTNDSGYVAAGSMDFTGSGDTDFYLVRLRAAGNTEWAQRIGGSRQETAYAVQQTSDLGFVATGFTTSYGNGAGDCFVVRLSANGSTIWSRRYGGAGWDVGKDIRQTRNGGFVIAGWTDQFHAGRPDFWLMRLGPAGDSLWSRVYGAGQWDKASSIRETRDGGFILAGSIYTSASWSDFYVVKTDSLGNVIWSRAYAGRGWEEANAVRETVDGGYIVVGNTTPYNGGWEDVLVLRLSASGDSLWSRVLGRSGQDYGYSIEPTRDGGYVVAGSTISAGVPNTDLWLFKLGNVLSADGSGTTLPDEYFLSVYPNPFNARTVISLALPLPRDVSLSLFDIAGRQVQVLYSGILPAGTHRLPLDATNLPSGNYFVRLYAPNSAITHRVLLVR